MPDKANTIPATDPTRPVDDVPVTQADKDLVARLSGLTRADGIAAAEQVVARHRLASVSSASAEAVTEAAKPWADYHGDLPDYDHPLRPVFESGIQYTVELLAKQLDVAEWVPCDGTEEFDGDLGGTLMNIVLEAMPKDEHGDAIWPRDLPGNAASPEPVPATNQAGEVEREAIAISADDREDARKYIAGRCDAAEERGDRAITVNIPALRLALSEPAPATDRAGEAEGRFWLIVHKPGNVPDRKGSWPIADMAKVLREFIAARPDSYLHVLTVDRYGVPEIQHGPEALQMSDGRSVGVGRKHNARTLAAHTEAACTCGSPYYDVGAHLSTCPAALATQPATSQEGEAQQWRHKLWVVACHATGGGIPEIEGVDRSANDICVQITQSRNAIYQAGKDASLAATPTPPDLRPVFHAFSGAAGSHPNAEQVLTFAEFERAVARIGGAA